LILNIHTPNVHLLEHTCCAVAGAFLTHVISRG
jgi:hypothetical protein